MKTPLFYNNKILNTQTHHLKKSYKQDTLLACRFLLCTGWQGADRSYCFRDLMQSCEATQIMSEKIDSVQPRAVGKC